MASLLPSLDRGAPLPLSAQIVEYYANAIGAGRLEAGDRLPPIREVARQLGVTRTTVQDAYRRLAERGLVESTVGRGTSVIASPDEPRADGGGPRRPVSPFAAAALRRTEAMPSAPPVAGDELVADLAELAPDPERFPVDAWRTAMDAVLRRRGPELLGYGMSTKGLPELRALYAERARVSDATACGEDILITGGAQQALDLALRTFCAPGDAVVVTDPSYHQLSGLLDAHGLEPLAVAFRPEGIDLEQLSSLLGRPNVRLVYLMPTFHNPTGLSLAPRQRREVMRVLASTDVPVVEDEYQHALRFRGDPLPSLRSLDRRGLTITVSTASKELFPALRIGQVLASGEVLRAMTAVKRFMDLETSPLLQAALVEFIVRGSMDRYLDELRDELRRRHAALQRTATAELPEGCSVTDPDGGFVAWLSMPQPGQADRLAEMAGERGVRVVAGRAFDPHDRPSRGVRLCLARSDCRQIEAGVRVLGSCAREILATPVAARSFL